MADDQDPGYRDLKFGDLVLDQSYEELPGKIQYSELLEVIGPFVTNLDRVSRSIRLPGFVAFYSATFWEASRSFMERANSAFADLTIENPNQDATWVRFRSFYTQFMERRGLNWMESLDRTNETVKLFQGIANDSTPVAGKESEVGFESLLSWAILGVWTAFETLAGDLWEVALNAKPAGLAELNGHPRRIAKLAGTRLEKTESDGESRGHAGEGRSVSLRAVHQLTTGSYDLRDKMGSLLKSEFKFTSLTGVRQAYSAAFNDHPERIDEALADRSLDALSLVRNLIVHKAGVADRVYVNDSGTVPTAPKLADRQSLQLDGATTRDLVNPVIQRSVELVRAVDSYLARPR